MVVRIGLDVLVISILRMSWHRGSLEVKFILLHTDDQSTFRHEPIKHFQGLDFSRKDVRFLRRSNYNDSAVVMRYVLLWTELRHTFSYLWQIMFRLFPVEVP